MSIALRPNTGRYSPLYFLASLGAGGLAVTFFMYLMFWVPHPGQPVPVFEDIAAAWSAGGWVSYAIPVALLGIAVFAALNIWMLVANIAAYNRFAQTEGFDKLLASNANTQRLAMPLAFAMSINAGFILGLVFVPGLWGIVEYLFPLALIAFGATGYLALRMIGQFLSRVLTEPDSFEEAANASFAQMLPAFALSMVAVGFAAPAAMSHTPLTVAAGLIGSTFFAAGAVILAGIALIAGVISMLRHGLIAEQAPTVLVIVPILTVLGIMMIRQAHGLHVVFEAHGAKADTLMLTSQLLSVQLLFGLLGLALLSKTNYVQQFLREGLSPGAYALVCPGVALSVMLHFWINKGLVGAGLIAKFGIAYWGLTALALGLQFGMIALVVYLNRQHFGAARTAGVPAE